MTNTDIQANTDLVDVIPAGNQVNNREHDALAKIELIQNALKWLNDSATVQADDQTIEGRYMAITDAWEGVIEVANALFAHMATVRELTQQKAHLMTQLAMSQSTAIALRENAMNEARKRFIEEIAIALDLSPSGAGIFLDVVTGREMSVSAFTLDDLSRRAEETVEDVLWTKSETDTEEWGEDWDNDDDELG